MNPLSRIERLLIVFITCALAGSGGALIARSAGVADAQTTAAQRAVPLSTDGGELTRFSSVQYTPPTFPTPNGRTDYVATLTYNRAFDPNSGWTFDDPSREWTQLASESYWNGSSELNFDIGASGSVMSRPAGISASQTGNSMGLRLGGSPFASGAGGVTLAGGAQADQRQLQIIERAGATPTENLFDVIRPDNTASFTMRDGGIPRMIFDLGHGNAIGEGSFGVMKFNGAPPGGEAVINYEGSGTSARLLRSRPVSTDTASRFDLFGDGRLDWGSGAANPDTALYRAASAVLRTDGQIRTGDGVTIKVKNGPPIDADYRTPVDGLIGADAAGIGLHVRVGGVWRSIPLQ